MLVLTRKLDESIKVGEDIYVTVVEVRHDGRVKLGITAPKDVLVLRTELLGRDRDQELQGGRA